MNNNTKENLVCTPFKRKNFTFLLAYLNLPLSLFLIIVLIKKWNSVSETDENGIFRNVLFFYMALMSVAQIGLDVVFLRARHLETNEREILEFWLISSGKFELLAVVLIPFLYYYVNSPLLLSICLMWLGFKLFQHCLMTMFKHGDYMRKYYSINVDAN